RIGCRGCGADGDAGRRGAIRSGRARQGPGRAALMLLWFLAALPLGR
ncbi:major facilitator superfamily MFS_1 domain protein, partial [Mycobacterium xenopi 4042]